MYVVWDAGWRVKGEGLGVWYVGLVCGESCVVLFCFNLACLCGRDDWDGLSGGTDGVAGVRMSLSFASCFGGLVMLVMVKC